METDTSFLADQQPVAPPPAATVPLTDLPAGRCGWVVDVEAAGEDTERLKVMGVCSGRKVRLVRRGDPMILCVWGTRVGVSRRLAQQVYVQPCQGPTHNPACRHPQSHVAPHSTEPGRPGLGEETLN